MTAPASPLAVAAALAVSLVLFLAVHAPLLTALPPSSPRDQDTLTPTWAPAPTPPPARNRLILQLAACPRLRVALRLEAVSATVSTLVPAVSALAAVPTVAADLLWPAPFSLLLAAPLDIELSHGNASTEKTRSTRSTEDTRGRERTAGTGGLHTRGTERTKSTGGFLSPGPCGLALTVRMKACGAVGDSNASASTGRVWAAEGLGEADGVVIPAAWCGAASTLTLTAEEVAAWLSPTVHGLLAALLPVGQDASSPALLANIVEARITATTARIEALTNTSGGMAPLAPNATSLLAAAKAALRANNITAAHDLALAALQDIDATARRPETHSPPYFPFEQQLAVLLPLSLPAAAGLVRALVGLWRQWRKKARVADSPASAPAAPL